MRKHLTYEDAKSSKFWEVEQSGSNLTIRYGRIGTNGQTKEKSFGDEAAALKEANKLIGQKTKKGYVEQTSEDASDTATETAATPAEKAPAKKATAKKKAPTKKKAPEPPPETDGWVPCDAGGSLAIKDGKLVARNAKGKELKSVSKKMKTSPQGEMMLDVAKMMKAHAEECLETVERWMLRSLPVPSALLEKVWPDATWRALLENTVIAPASLDDDERIGFLKDVDPERGLGLVNLDGESVWLGAETVRIPHPILLAELADFRELAMELGIAQGLGQLMRETFAKPDRIADDVTSVTDYENGQFEEARHATARVRAIGCRMSGGYATTSVHEDGALHQANFWVGAEDPWGEAVTEDLSFELNGKTLRLNDVPPVTYSEGVRMASLIYAARKIEEEENAS
ncbi:MAG: DUF4132 domain-containing protein [Sandaracinaceae bacterium]